MSLLDSPLLREFVRFIMANRGRDARVQQQRRRLRQFVAMIRSVADAAEGRTVRDGSLAAWLHLLREEAFLGQAVLNATDDDGPARTASAVVGSAKRLLALVRALFVCDPEVDRLGRAVEGVESLAGDMDRFLKVLELSTAAAGMNIDSGDAVPFNHLQLQVGVAASGWDWELPIPGAKRKRDASCDDDEASDGGSTPAEAEPGLLQRVKRAPDPCVDATPPVVRRRPPSSRGAQGSPSLDTAGGGNGAGPEAESAGEEGPDAGWSPDSESAEPRTAALAHHSV